MDQENLGEEQSGYDVPRPKTRQTSVFGRFVTLGFSVCREAMNTPCRWVQITANAFAGAVQNYLHNCNFLFNLRDSCNL